MIKQYEPVLGPVRAIHFNPDNFNYCVEIIELENHKCVISSSGDMTAISFSDGKGSYAIARIGDYIVFDGLKCFVLSAGEFQSCYKETSLCPLDKSTALS
jgi:hypothetical protein